MKILAVGDLHFRENLGYSEYVKGERKEERDKILNFIVNSSSDCESVVLMGDCFNSKNPTSDVVKSFVNFLERFGEKKVYIISGNHCKRGDGSTALDFLKEIKGKPNWDIMTEPSRRTIGGKEVNFLPYMNKAELGAIDDKEATIKIMGYLQNSVHDIIFLHHAISDTNTVSEQNTNLFNEAVLPRSTLEEWNKLVVGSHIHFPQTKNRTIVTGSIFNNEAGETEKFIWKIHDDLTFEKIKLPGRPIYSLVDPSSVLLGSLEPRSIVKVVLTNKGTDVEAIKKLLERFDAYLLLEQYPNQRRKLHFDSGAIDFSIENLLKIYSEEKGVDLNKLMTGFELIKQ